MKEITITTQFSVFDSVQELPTDIQDLMQQAVAIRKNAYAPYSLFRVGVALVLAGCLALVLVGVALVVACCVTG